MPDDAPELDPPDADTVYERYLVTCKMSVVEPVSRERARELVSECARVIADNAIQPTKY